MQEAIENGRKVWKLVCGARLMLNLDRVIAAGYGEATSTSWTPTGVGGES